jgi:predicted enzyme related to lactoylglutathione lyase
VGLIDEIDDIFYQVCNMDRAVEFYGEVLALPMSRREGRDWAEFDVGGRTLALSGELAVAPQGGGATVVVRTGDIDGLRDALDAAGATHSGVEDLGGARMLSFHDPDGNELVALQPD